MPEWLTHPITISILTVVVVQLIINAIRNYVLKKRLEQNVRELEATLQESEERIRQVMRGFEENRKEFADSFQALNSLGKPPSNEPPQS